MALGLLACSNEGTADEAERPSARVRELRLTMSLETDDVLELVDELRALAEREHGYVERARSDRESGTLLLRVPSGRLAAVRRAAGRLGTVRGESEYVADAVDQSAELAARLESARAAEERMIALDEPPSAAREDRLASVRGEVEALEAQARTLEGRVEYAHFTARVSRTEIAFYEQPWATLAAAGRIGRSIATAIAVALGAVIAVVGPTALPFALLLSAILAVFKAAMRRRAARRSS